MLKSIVRKASIQNVLIPAIALTAILYSIPPRANGLCDCENFTQEEVDTYCRGAYGEDTHGILSYCDDWFSIDCYDQSWNFEGSYGANCG